MVWNVDCRESPEHFLRADCDSCSEAASRCDRTAAHFDFHGAVPVTFWLILTKDDVSLCLTDPGFEINVLGTAELAANCGEGVSAITKHSTTMMSVSKARQAFARVRSADLVQIRQTSRDSYGAMRMRAALLALEMTCGRDRRGIRGT
jgi:hypothetical protein